MKVRFPITYLLFITNICLVSYAAIIDDNMYD